MVKPKGSKANYSNGFSNGDLDKRIDNLAINAVMNVEATILVWGLSVPVVSPFSNPLSPHM